MAVLGLGRLGAAVATRLSERGLHVTGWTRSNRGIHGIGTVDDPDAAITESDVIVMCLFDGQACGEVLARLRLPTTSTLVNLSTVTPEDAVDLARQTAAAGAGYVHAPVIGSAPAARAGALTVLAGEDELPAGALEVLENLGDVMRCGDAATAATMKLLANGALAGALLAVRDSRRCASQLDIDDRAWSVLERTPLGTLVRGKRPRLVPGSTGGADFTVDALVKDLRLLSDRAPSAAAQYGQIKAARDSGVVAGDDDIAALCLAPDPARGHDSRRPSGLSIDPSVTAPPEVLAPLEAYAAGHATGDAACHRRAFLPTAHVEGLREGRFVSWSVDDYCALFTGEPSADEPMRRRRIEQVAVNDTVATATMTLWHGPDLFTDAFVLLYVDDKWRIANKVYHRSSVAAP